jgi:hypothetical protein
LIKELLIITISGYLNPNNLRSEFTRGIYKDAMGKDITKGFISELVLTTPFCHAGLSGIFPKNGFLTSL